MEFPFPGLDAKLNGTKAFTRLRSARVRVATIVFQTSDAIGVVDLERQSHEDRRDWRNRAHRLEGG